VLATRAGVNVQTIRFYERLRLLPEPKRTDGRYCSFAESDLKRLLFIRQAKVLGFSLDEIRDILQLRERGRCPCDEVVTIAERHLADVEPQLRNLTRFRDGLQNAVRQWKKSGQQSLSADSICSLIERTAQPN